jgi:hypothetical protein
MTYDRHTTDILSEFLMARSWGSIGPFSSSVLNKSIYRSADIYPHVPIYYTTVVICSQGSKNPLFNGKIRGLKCNVSLISTRVCLKFRYPIPSTVSSSCSCENGHFRGWNMPHFWHAAVWWNTARDEWRARANGDWAEDLSCSVSSLSSAGDGLQEIHGAGGFW